VTNRYLVPLEHLVNSNSHSNFKFKGKIKLTTVGSVSTVVEQLTRNREFKGSNPGAAGTGGINSTKQNSIQKKLVRFFQ
jgi:hypothetical protein